MILSAYLISLDDYEFIVQVANNNDDAVLANSSKNTNNNTIKPYDILYVDLSSNLVRWYMIYWLTILYC